jgi:hypothetical protein
MRSSIRLLAIAALSSALTACGGGGGSSIHPDTTFRSNAIGDSWTYSVSIDFTGFGTYGGTLTEALSSDTYNSAQTIRSTQTFDLQLQQGPATLTSYSEIGTSGTLLAMEVNGSLESVASDTFSVPSTIGAGTSTSGKISLADGETLTETYRVVGTATVATEAGTFECWVVRQTVAWSDGASDAFTLWEAPQVGNYVKISDFTTNSDGSSYSYSASLTSMVTAAATERGIGPLPMRLPPMPLLGRG